MSVCKWCGAEYKTETRWRKDCCSKCGDKVLLLPKFAKARDDLRQQLGLKRLTQGSECVDD